MKKNTGLNRDQLLVLEDKFKQIDNVVAAADFDELTKGDITLLMEMMNYSKEYHQRRAKGELTIEDYRKYGRFSVPKFGIRTFQ